MPRNGPERILLIGDSDRQIESAIALAIPGAQVVVARSYFDGIAELVAGSFNAVMAAAEPIERRPEPAVRTLRELASDARLVLFGHPTLEPLSRKMLEFGCDDYVVTPVNPGELQQVFGGPVLRIVPDSPTDCEPAAESSAAPLLLDRLPLADIFLEALSEQPHDAPCAAVRRLSEQLAPAVRLTYAPDDGPAPLPPDGCACLSHAVRVGTEQFGSLHLILPREEQSDAARHFLARLAELVGKLQTLQDRHNRLQRLAITDELTGLYNARYFRHFLSRVLERAREKLFPVTLLIFDIDDFKKYNDQYGHGVGDEILKQTAHLIRRCCREHDLVARLGGDEFAVVFWEKEGPRQAKDPKHGPSGRPPQTPEQVLERFKRLLATQEFSGLGPGGKGVLTISGGIAVYPYHASSMDELIELADRRLMFGAKQAGKNSIFLIGGDTAGSRP